MTSEQQLTSLPFSKWLKELNVKQESLFYFTRPHGMKDKWVLQILDEDERKRLIRGYYDLISAFSVAELGEMLKDHIADMRPCNVGWEVRRMIDLGGKEAEYASASTLADAMAKMLIHLIESGIVKI